MRKLFNLLSCIDINNSGINVRFNQGESALALL